MKKRWVLTSLLVTVFLMCVASTVVYAFDWTPREKLMARRAARVDAIRKLAETIKGLEIDSSTYVRDFVTESDDIETALDTFLRGMTETDVDYYDDGTCEVTMQVTLERVIAELKHIRDGVYKGDKWKGTDFTQIRTRTERKTFEAVGTGVAPSAAVDMDEEDMDADEDWQVKRKPGIPPQWENIPAQVRLMVERGATVDAYRNLAETIKGLRISSSTYVRDFVTESDEIEAEMTTFIKGVQIRKVRFLPDLTAEATVDVTIERVIEELTHIRDGVYKGDKWKGVDFTEIKRHTERKVVEAKGYAAVPDKYAKMAGDDDDEDEMYDDDDMDEIPRWATRVYQAEGLGVAPEDADNIAQARIMALRAAKIDAYRNLMEQIRGVRIASRTTVEDFVLESDEIEAEMEDVIQGARVVEEEFFEDNSAMVIVELDMMDVYDLYMSYR